MIRLLAAGNPVRIEEIASAAGVEPPEVEAMLHGQPGAEWDEHGRLVGFGLTHRPTAHRLTLAGREFFTWCAMDTLFLSADRWRARDRAVALPGDRARDPSRA